jgi:hypothetical protein
MTKKQVKIFANICHANQVMGVASLVTATNYIGGIMFKRHAKHGLFKSGDELLNEVYEVHKMTFEIQRGKHCPEFKCFKCGRKVLTRQKRIKVAFTRGKKNVCCHCGKVMMDDAIKRNRISINNVRKLMRNIHDKDLVLEAL